MDWALVRVDAWPTDLREHAIKISEDLRFSRVRPGAQITSVGRTSGQQLGIINTAKCLIRHGFHFTEEWSIIKPPDLALEDWISGGIGVDGDSGAWIVSQSSWGIRSLYGMLWGRDRVNTNPICLFTDISDIIDDIEDIEGVETVSLPTDSQGRGERSKEPLVEPSSPIVVHSDDNTSETLQESQIQAGRALR